MYNKGEPHSYPLKVEYLLLSIKGGILVLLSTKGGIFLNNFHKLGTYIDATHDRSNLDSRETNSS